VRVVLDSSVLIAAFVTRAGVCSELYEDVLQHHDLILSRHILDEVGRKLSTKFLVGGDLVQKTIFAIERAAQIVDPAPVAEASCRDPDDLPILGTAVAGHAELLVTVDNDLLVLESFEQTQVIRPGDFWKRIYGS
jgi:putative PIN family toxin of toxin-antitoxin system